MRISLSYPDVPPFEIPDSNVLACLECCFRNGKVRTSRRRNDDGIHFRVPENFIG